MFLFPACAGVILYVVCIVKINKTFPRMCGGDPTVSKECLYFKDFSPHVRG